MNQFTVIEGQHNRRPDIEVFVNGLPLGLIELKNAGDEGATIWSAYAQVQTSMNGALKGTQYEVSSNTSVSGHFIASGTLAANPTVMSCTFAYKIQ
ncbi:MAG: type restriction enzyme subunit [Chthoniobacter sp.]|nr:type restriction enzyme subunit [Chthoniobacter sp.]